MGPASRDSSALSSKGYPVVLIPFNQLFSRYHIKTDGVLHLGANTGQEVEAYVALGIKRVIWVEALPDVCAQLAKNVMKYPGHVALLGCLSDRDGDQVDFNRASNGSQSSSFLEFGTHAKKYPGTVFIEKIRMFTSRVDTLLIRHGVEIGQGWFLNLDSQGSELLVLKGMGQLLKQFNWAYIEVNQEELYVGCPMVGEIDDFLKKFGFVGVETKMMKEGWGDKLYRRAYDSAT